MYICILMLGVHVIPSLEDSHVPYTILFYFSMTTIHRSPYFIQSKCLTADSAVNFVVDV